MPDYLRGRTAARHEPEDALPDVDDVLPEVDDIFPSEFDDALVDVSDTLKEDDGILPDLDAVCSAPSFLPELDAVCSVPSFLPEDGVSNPGGPLEMAVPVTGFHVGADGVYSFAVYFRGFPVREESRAVVWW